MNLLFLTPQLPHPPRQGTAIRNWGLIKSLSTRHTITLLTFAQLDQAVTSELVKACKRIETVPPPVRSRAQRLGSLLTSPRPDLAHRLESPEFSRRLRQLLESRIFEAVIVEGLELARYIEKDKIQKIVFDAHNCETLLQRRAFETDLHNPRRWPMALYSFIQSRRLAQFESQALSQATHVTCVSAEDAAALNQLTPAVNPIIVPNGIFIADYDKSKIEDLGTARDMHAKSKIRQLVFTGKMDYRPNVDAVTWFANDILPLVRREQPQVQFVIVGQKPTEAVQELAKRPDVLVTGAVEDTQPYIVNAAAYVAPLRMGGGTRFKLLEALALRSPIISTTVGAEGFPVANGKEILLADSPSDFAQSVLKILSDEQQRQVLTDAGYEFVKGYDWSQIVPRLEALLLD